MSKEGTDQHHDIDFTGLDFEGIEREEEMDKTGDTYVQPIIEDFKIGLLYESFVDCIRNGASSSSARQYFHADKACTLAVRCRSADEKTLFLAALSDILEGGYRQKFVGDKPAKAQAIDFDHYISDTKKTGKDGLLSVLFEHRRIFIFMSHGQCLPEEIRGFVDAEIELQCTAEALETAVKNYIDQKFWLPPRLARELMQVPVAQLMSIFAAHRSTGYSVNLAYAWLKRSRSSKIARTKTVASPEPTIDDLHGLGAAGEWGRDLALDLADWKAGKISWAEVDRGVLISGAPGTGKTTFAAALARTCGVKFVSTSMAQWQAKGHLGDYLKAMRKSFEEAQKSVPCILFIDEFDSSGDRNSKSSDNDDYIRRAVNGLLECLDGIGGREGVVVVGATNHPDKVDEALRRPGRLDKLVVIPLPDAAARNGILRFHLKGDLESVDLTPVVSRTDGMAGAWLEGLIRDARRSARRQRRELKLVNLVQACPARERMPEASLRQSAIHEAGHAVMSLELGKSILSAKVTRDFLASETNFHGGSVQITRAAEHIYLRSKSYSITMVKQLLGGLAAEDHFFGERNDGGWGDLREATFWAARQWLSTGQQDTLTFLSEPDVEPVLAALKSRPDVQAKVEKLLQECMTEVKAVIEKRQADVQTIADALVERGSLDGAEITVLLAPKAKIFSLPRPKDGRTHDDVEEYAYEFA
ncbi:AAA family ATPase [Brucella sp. BE17]|uniref:AAA family ATPase n=1 Tax=Brucella sp. BE17 TaxID=3142977 RepID=UPI0031BBC52C